MPRTKSPDSTTQNGAGGDRRSARIKLRKAERAESSGSRRTSNWIDGKSNKKEKEPPVMRLNAREHLGILKKNLITLEQEIQDMKEEYERKLIDLEERADTIRVILILLWGAYLILTHICMVTICLTKNKDEIVDVNSFIALAKDQGNYLEVRLGENNGRARLGLLHLDCYRALLGLISAPERMDLLLYPTKPCNTILSQILNVDTKELVSAAPLPPPPPVTLIINTRMHIHVGGEDAPGVVDPNEPETVNFLAERKVKKPEKKQGRKQRKKKRSR
eukprot:1391873-Amorphochlora_amoeboformis.AAC.1